MIAPEKSILVPTAHDEPAIRLSIFREVFSLPYALVFNTPAEKEFAQSLFNLQQILKVAGVGVDIPTHINRKAFKQKQGLIEDYFYYGGRIDAGKGCDELIEFYLQKKRNLPDFPFLILSGHLSMNLPADPSIVYMGYLNEQDKAEAQQGATGHHHSIDDGESLFVAAGRFCRPHSRSGEGRKRRLEGTLHEEQRGLIL